MSFLSGDFKYEESQTLEFKESQAGLPDDMWETYSAFANTEGGEIVLGVCEDPKTHGFVPVGVSNAGDLIDEIWKIVANPKKVERNILLPDDVKRCSRNGMEFVVVSVPRAERDQKPVEVYSKRDKSYVAYVRCGSGDKPANGESLRQMQYDSCMGADRTALEEFDLDALCPETLRRYRTVFAGNRPTSPFNSDSDEDFLYHIGAVNKGRDGALHPTRAGLLSFGFEYEITRYRPAFLLDYREEGFDEKRWTDRLVSQDGSWSGNLIDFYLSVSAKLERHFKQPFKTDDAGLNHAPGTELMEAVNEAIANAEVHAHYGAASTVKVILKPSAIEIENPGDFLIDREVAIAGGYSESRNPTIMKMFGLIGATDRAGSGLRKIWQVWTDLFDMSPILEEHHQPAAVKLVLSFPVQSGELGMGRRPKRKAASNVEGLCALEIPEEGITAKEAARALGVSERVAQKRLKAEFEAGALDRKKDGRGFRYLKKA